MNGDLRMTPNMVQIVIITNSAGILRALEIETINLEDWLQIAEGLKRSKNLVS